MAKLNMLVCFAMLSTVALAQGVDTARVDQVLTNLFGSQNKPSPGTAVTVLHQGKVIAKKHYGFANLEHSAPYTHSSPTRLIYSMGREFMAAGLGVMEAEGLLKFEDKVMDYFPKLPAWSREVTVQDLLNHSSGFDDEWSLLLMMHADMRNRVDPEQFLTLLYNQPKPQITRGEGYMYNNSDFALLRMIMEKAARQPLPLYLRQKLFAPLQMSSTFMNDDIDAVIPGLAESYQGSGPFRRARFYKTSPGGNYRMVTTADDLEKWAKAVSDPESILGKSFKRLYKEARPIPVLSPEKHFVFGHEWRERNGVDYVFHGGVDDGFYMVRIPSKEIIIISLGNGGPSIDALKQLTELYLPPKSVQKHAIPTIPANPAKVSTAELKNYEGRYFEVNSKGYNSHVNRISYYDFKAQGDSLQFYYRPDASFGLGAFGDGIFMDMEDRVPLQFSRPFGGGAMQLKVWPEPTIMLEYERMEEKPAITKNYLQNFVGRFHSPHLDYYFRIVQDEQGNLIVKRPTLPDTPLEPHGNDSFLLQADTGGYKVNTVVTFTRDKKGEIDGFGIRYSRLMHHRFDKVGK